MSPVNRAQIREAIEQLLDDGVDPLKIRKILLPFVRMEEQTLKMVVEHVLSMWLINTENRMRDYAQEDSWSRLQNLLTVYQKVVQ